MADTAVIGNTGTTVGLGAIALGALVFTFVYWSFGFLRMGTTGFVAQASGAGDDAEVRAALARSLLLGGGIGVSLVLLQQPIAWAALELLGATPEVERLTRGYYDLRIWGAPASLGTFAILGTFVGLGRTRQVLVTQLFLNGVNIGLDVLFAGVLGRKSVRTMMSAFAPRVRIAFARSSTLHSAMALLDGYAHASEVLVGRAVGTRSRERLDRAVRSATELSGVTAAALAAGVIVAGPRVVALLTDLAAVRDGAVRYLPYAAVYVVVSFAAFQLDGIFIGATRTRDMRNASIASFTTFLLASFWLVPRAANDGLWIAFVLYVVTRAITLLARYPALRAAVAD